MDLTRSIKYRGFDLNNIRADSVSRDMVGCEVTRASYHGVAGVGYDEKKAMADGFDSGDVWLGKRAIQLSGNLYGRTRPELFDILTDFMGRLSPTSAYDADESNKGYLPFDFWMPTERTSMTLEDGSPNDPPWSGRLLQDGPFPDGLKHLMFLARPVAMPSVDFASDVHGGEDDKALSLAWTAVLEARLPWMLNYSFTNLPVTGAAGSHSTMVTNRGNRPAAFQLYLVAPYKMNGGTNPAKFHLTGAGTRMHISIPPLNAVQKIRYDSYHKVLEVNGRLRMDLLTFDSGFDHGEVKPGITEVRWSRVGTKNLKSGSYFRFRDTWA